MKINEKELKRIARNVRINIIKMTSMAQTGHPGPSFSIVEILTALYFWKMNIDSKNIMSDNRDRLVLSKGHAAPALYAALVEKGIYDEKEFENFRKIGSPFQGHPNGKNPGIDATTGSLGIGLSQAVGMAFGAKRKLSNLSVYAVIGDGECDEGQIWEAALFAHHNELDNLVVFLDYNGDQFEGKVEEVISLSPLLEKWQAFGWDAFQFNGHDFNQIGEFLEKASIHNGKPKIGIAETRKGFGVSFMEGSHAYHARSLTEDEAKRALAELRN